MSMAPALTPTSYAVLGLLAVKPWSSYELAQQMDRALGRFWPRAESRLYEEPKKLVAHGLARASSEMVGNARARSTRSRAKVGSPSRNGCRRPAKTRARVRATHQWALGLHFHRPGLSGPTSRAGGSMRKRLNIALAVLVCAFGSLATLVRPAAADSSLPSLTVGDVSVWEGNAGSLVVKVPVDLSVVPSANVT